MKNYGINKKIFIENCMYIYAKFWYKINSFIPGKNKHSFKQNYSFVFKDNHPFVSSSNAIPKEKSLTLEEIVFSDLVSREEIGKLQQGIRKLLLKHRAGDRFLGLPINNFEEICRKIDSMDSILLHWHDSINCGLFDFRGERQSETFDYYGIQIKNVNSSYLSLEFTVHLTEKKQNELKDIITENYQETRGYAYKYLSSVKGGGAYQMYTLSHFNNDALKADRLFEIITSIEWDFFNKLKRFFPFVLHNKNIIPPRIEIYYTDIDYHDRNTHFWNSIGISDYQGQFIDEQQKLFFDDTLSGRYEDHKSSSRIIYIVKDDGIEPGHFRSIKDFVYFHIQDHASDYFKFMFLDILSHSVGRTIIEYQKQFNKIKLNRNRLRHLLKMRYNFERSLDYYISYARDDIWTPSIDRLHKEIYLENDNFITQYRSSYCLTNNNFCNKALAGARKIDNTIQIMRVEFDSKEQILQHLYDYLDTNRNWWLNFFMMVMTALTLFFVIFPNRAEWLANIIRPLWKEINKLFITFIHLFSL